MRASGLDQDEFARRDGEIQTELRGIVERRTSGELRSVSTEVRDAFARLFGQPQGARDWNRFLLHIAPLMRRLMIDATRAGRTSGTVNLSAIDLEQWLSRLEGFDPECARMIDLRYFLGLTTRETAATLGLTPQAVIRDLRFAKAWLKARTRWVYVP